MWQKFLTTLCAVVLVTWPLMAECQSPKEVVYSGLKFRYQANPIDPVNVCKDSPSVRNSFVEGVIEIIFNEGQSFAQGERHLRDKYTLRLPLSAVSPVGSVAYVGLFKFAAYGIPMSIDYEAIFVGTLSGISFNFDVKYRVKGSNSCWKQRYLRSRSNAS